MKYLAMFLMCFSLLFAETYYAQAPGNINAVEWDTAAGGGGDDLTWANLQTDDILDCNGEAIAVNVFGWECAEITNAEAGGDFNYTSTGTNTITCDITCDSDTDCFDIDAASGTLTINGDIQAGDVGGRGEGIVTNGAMTLIINGDSYGGGTDGTTSIGIRLYSGTILQLNGTAVGGSNATCYGVSNDTGSSLSYVESAKGGTHYGATGVFGNSTSDGIIVKNLIIDPTSDGGCVGGEIYLDLETITYYTEAGGDPVTLRVGSGSSGSVYNENNTGGLYGP